MKKGFASAASLARLRRIPAHQLRYRLRVSLEQFLSHTPWPQVPRRGKLIAIADALMAHTEGKLVTIYLIMVKRPQDTTAIILPPYLGVARENDAGWFHAFAAIPETVRKRIFCLVSDGKRGLRLAAKRYGWLLQRCHFHALGSFERRLSARGRMREEGTALRHAVVTVLRSRSERRVREALARLVKLSHQVASQMLRQMIREFIRYHEHFRTYLAYPAYRIPTTTGAVESLNSLLRDMLRRTRGLRTHRSLETWVAGFVKHQRSITCNGSKYQPN